MEAQVLGVGEGSQGEAAQGGDHDGRDQVEVVGLHVGEGRQDGGQHLAGDERLGHPFLDADVVTCFIGRGWLVPFGDGSAAHSAGGRVSGDASEPRVDAAELGPVAVARLPGLREDFVGEVDGYVVPVAASQPGHELGVHSLVGGGEGLGIHGRFSVLTLGDDGCTQWPVTHITGER